MPWRGPVKPCTVELGVVDAGWLVEEGEEVFAPRSWAIDVALGAEPEPGRTDPPELLCPEPPADEWCCWRMTAESARPTVAERAVPGATTPRRKKAPTASVIASGISVSAGVPISLRKIRMRRSPRRGLRSLATGY